MGAAGMFMVAFGTEKVPKSLSVPGGGDQVLREPIFGAVIETAPGWVLLDTVIGRTALTDPAALTEIYGAHLHPAGPPGPAPPPSR